MRYADTHKNETHARLVRIAGTALREKGPEGISVAQVMREAGLTHGGFYAHFKSKDALIVEALDGVFAGAKRKFLRAIEGLPPRHALATYVDFYVSPRHRDDRANGCPVTALNSDLPRQSKAVRKAFDGGLRSMVLGIEHLIKEAGIAGDTE